MLRYINKKSTINVKCVLLCIVNTEALRGSITMYIRALEILERILSEQDLLVLNTYLKLSMAKMELDTLSDNKDSRACDSALKVRDLLLIPALFIKAVIHIAL